jgi:sulfate adenylyltransferase
METTCENSLLLTGAAAEALHAEAATLPGADLEKRQLCDLELIINRAFAPLTGFLVQKDYESVLERMRLADGTLWPLPVCLDVPARIGERLSPGDTLALNDREGFLLGVLDVASVWRPDRALEARAVFGTDDPEAHPGVRRLLEETGEWYVGGRVRALYMPRHYDALDLRLTPEETRLRFAQLGWRKTLGVHSATPLHRAHLESLVHAAGQAGANLFLQPAVNQPALVDDDHFVRVRCYRAFMKHLPQDLGLLGLIPLAPRFAGPREALLQAIVHGNHGCTHTLVSDDQADPCRHNGRDPFYERGAALLLLEEHAAETGVSPVRLTRMVYHMGSESFMPEERALGEAESLPERELLRRLELELPVPEWFTFPEVLDVLRQAHPPRRKQGFTVFLTGLSGSGKSTLAKILYVKFMQAGDRPVTLLDGDIVRKNLSSELNFSREHRDINIRRIGFVASQITKNRGIAICAPIAPYEESRRYNRELISRYGGYLEVYVSTPLSVCEARDVKGLYAKARAGLKKGVTGIDDPYEAPVNPDLSLDTSNLTPTETAQRVVLLLREMGYVR